MWVSLEEELEARRGGSGRKLQLLCGRAETRVKISEMRRCWTDVSYTSQSAGRWWRGRRGGGAVPAGCRTWSGAAGRCC